MELNPVYVIGVYVLVHKLPMSELNVVTILCVTHKCNTVMHNIAQIIMRGRGPLYCESWCTGCGSQWEIVREKIVTWDHGCFFLLVREWKRSSITCIHQYQCSRVSTTPFSSQIHERQSLFYKQKMRDEEEEEEEKIKSAFLKIGLSILVPNTIRNRNLTEIVNEP